MTLDSLELPSQFGRYRLVSELGRGGMGRVYLAEDPQMERQVAVKLPVLGRDSEKAVKRFLREARAAAAIRHPNVCPVHDVGEVDGQLYLAMAYIEGFSLAEWVRRQPEISIPLALLIVRKLAEGLEAAHAVGVIHRDLKPGNILIDSAQEPQIIDFGLARRFDAEETVLTATGAIVGTPAYMAPEQITGDLKQIGPAADIYALGIVLYELISGDLPFCGNMATMLGSIVSEPPPKLRKKIVDLSPTVEAVYERALAKEPGERFQSAAEFASALREAQDGA